MSKAKKNSPLIEIRGLTKNYETDAGPVEVLKGVDLSVNRGEIVAIMGPSGCGKSTMLYVLGLLQPPTGGEYRMQGTDVFKLSPAKQSLIRRDLVGFVLQTCNLFEHSTVYENLEYPLIYKGIDKRRRKRIIEESLDKVNLSHRINHAANRLSGGEQQRVAIARALVSGPKIILGDEPTGQLDEANSRRIMKFFKKIVYQSGTTMVIVTHDVNVAAQCSRAYSLIEGKLQER